MSDPLANALARLAPDVDPAASRELFERARGAGGEPSPTRDRWMLAAACVLLLVAGVAGIWVLASGGDDRAPAAPPSGGTTEPTTADSAPPRGDGTEFRLIAMEPVGDFDRRGIDVADTRAELDELLAGYRDSFDRYAGDVDPRSEVAVVIERPDNSCPVEFDRFTPVGDAWRVEWSEKPAGACEDIGLGWVYLLAVDRSALAGIDRFVLPAEQLGSTELPELSVSMPGTVDLAPEPAPSTLPTEATTIGAVVAGDEVGRHIVAGIAAATGPAELDELISRTGLDVAPPAVDFGNDVVIGVSIVDDACPAALTGFIVDAGNSDEAASLSALFDDAPDDCGGLGTVRSFLAVVPRSALADRFIATIPAGYTAGRPTGTLIDLTIAAPEQVLVAESSAPLGTIVAARDQATYNAMWEQLGAAVEPPVIDVDREVVVAFVIPDDACPPTFEGFDATPGNPYPLWTPRFVEDESTCVLPLISRLFVISVDRAVLAHGVTFRLAADDLYGFAEQRYEVRLAEPSLVSATPSCGPTDAPVVDVTLHVTTPIDLRVVVRDGETTVGEAAIVWPDEQAGEIPVGVARQVPIEIAVAPTPFGEVLLVDGDDPDRIVDRIPFDRTSVPDGFGCG